MTNPPLQLEQSFFDHIQIDAQRDYEPPDSEQALVELPVDVEVKTAKLKDDPDRWNVILHVTVARHDTTIPPYVIDAECWSVFRVNAEDLDEEQAAQLSVVTGGSILYSSMREYLGMLTARGPWGGYFLPTISLVGAELSKTGGPTGGRKSAAKAPTARSKAATKANAARTPKARSEASRKANVSRGAAGRSSAAKKAAATRAAKKRGKKT